MKITQTELVSIALTLLCVGTSICDGNISAAIAWACVLCMEIREIVLENKDEAEYEDESDHTTPNPKL